MTTARDIMHTGATCIGEHETLQHAAQQMRDLGVGSLPIRGDDDGLRGIITDRDIVTKCIASGADPASVTAGELAQGSRSPSSHRRTWQTSCAPWSNTKSIGYRSSRASSRWA
jgi:CBS-domain-containing membrane protein